MTSSGGSQRGWHSCSPRTLTAAVPRGTRTGFGIVTVSVTGVETVMATAHATGTAMQTGTEKAAGVMTAKLPVCERPSGSAAGPVPAGPATEGLWRCRRVTAADLAHAGGTVAPGGAARPAVTAAAGTTRGSADGQIVQYLETAAAAVSRRGTVVIAATADPAGTPAGGDGSAIGVSAR